MIYRMPFNFLHAYKIYICTYLRDDKETEQKSVEMSKSNTAIRPPPDHP